jgi:hypothetical protein
LQTIGGATSPAPLTDWVICSGSTKFSGLPDGFYKFEARGVGIHLSCFPFLHSSFPTLPFLSGAPVTVSLTLIYPLPAPVPPLPSFPTPFTLSYMHASSLCPGAWCALSYLQNMLADRYLLEWTTRCVKLQRWSVQAEEDTTVVPTVSTVVPAAVPTVKHR